MSENLYTQFDNIFFEKTRLSMMTVMYKEELVSFNRFKKILEASDGAIYTHLQKLQDAKYVLQKKEIIGNKAQTFYFLSEEGKELFQRYLKFLEEIIS
ncbi:MAG: ArsR family transcriptional regulator [bacterium]|nr:ArsR family transcriptional regulator [bacterium]